MAARISPADLPVERSKAARRRRSRIAPRPGKDASHRSPSGPARYTCVHSLGFVGGRLAAAQAPAGKAWPARPAQATRCYNRGLDIERSKRQDAGPRPWRLAGSGHCATKMQRPGDRGKRPWGELFSWAWTCRPRFPGTTLALNRPIFDAPIRGSTQATMADSLSSRTFSMAMTASVPGSDVGTPSLYPGRFERPDS